MTLTWEHINEPIDPAVFTIEGMQLPPTAWIVDRRLEKPVIEGTVGRRAEVQKFKSSKPDNNRVILLIGNLAFLGGALFLILIRKFRKNTDKLKAPADGVFREPPPQTKLPASENP